MKWTALTVAVIGVLALLWIGGELHYQGCVDGAIGRTPERPRTIREEAEQFQGAPSERAEAVQGCSRLPF